MQLSKRLLPILMIMVLYTPAKAADADSPNPAFTEGHHIGKAEMKRPPRRLQRHK